MALPIIFPILMAAMSMGAGIIQGVSAVKNANAQAQITAQEAQDRINERAKNAKKLMQQQKTSFLKSGVYFNTGSALDVINETYDTMDKDVGAMRQDANTKINNFIRQGQTAFYGSLLQGVANAGLGFASAGGSVANLGSSVANSTPGLWAQNTYNSMRGWTKGGFSNFPTKNIV